MSEVTIRDYIGKEKELSAEEIKKMPAGSKIRRHSFDRYGNHCFLDMTVIQSGRKKMLTYHDYYDGQITRPIKKETDRFCYMEVLG